MNKRQTRNVSKPLSFWSQARTIWKLHGFIAATYTEHLNGLKHSSDGIKEANNAEVLVGADGTAIPFEMDLPRYSRPIRDAAGNIKRISRFATRQLEVKSTKFQTPSGHKIVIDPFLWNFATVLCAILPEDAQTAVQKWFTAWFNPDDASSSVYWVTKPRRANEMTMFHVDLGNASSECVVDLLLYLSESGSVCTILTNQLSPELIEQRSFETDLANDQFRTLWDPTWSTLFPRVVVEKAVNRIGEGHRMVNFHKDYTGIGIEHSDGAFYVGDGHDAWISHERLLFSSHESLAEWLCSQSNKSMSGCHEDQPLFEARSFKRNNQRLTLERLVAHAQSDKD